MRRQAWLMAIVAVLAWAAPRAAIAQAPEKEVVATISGKMLSGGVVTGLGWDGATLVIQTAALEKGEPKAHYFIAPGRGMELRTLDSLPPSVERYWKLKASRKSPTGLGTIVLVSGSKLPMYGIASQEKRFADAMDMGGTQISHEFRIGDLVIHRRRDTAPYDGEVWSWSPAELNRVAYTDEQGELWIATADGRGPERVLKGRFTLPAWSEDGRVLAFAERKGDGGKWEVSIVHLPERFRR